MICAIPRIASFWSYAREMFSPFAVIIIIMTKISIISENAPTHNVEDYDLMHYDAQFGRRAQMPPSAE
jgi:hypothetical protein